MRWKIATARLEYRHLLTALTLLASVNAGAQVNDSCEQATPFVWYDCQTFSPPYPQTVTLCYQFSTGGTSVNFDFGYFAFCPDLTVTYTLYSEACDSLTTNATGAFAIGPGAVYVVCGTVACGSPGGIKTVCTTEQMTLPVELTGVTAYPTDGGVVLEWSTATERNASHFAIYRGVDFTDWAALVQVAASGNSYTRKLYRWTDADPLNGTAYYRLDGVDFDGHVRTLMLLPVTWSRPDRSSLGPFDLLGRRVRPE